MKAKVHLGPQLGILVPDQLALLLWACDETALHGGAHGPEEDRSPHGGRGRGWVSFL